MEFLKLISQIIIVLGIFNVWLVRFNKKTQYRGSNSTSLSEEFKVYGYPDLFFYVIGLLKLSFAILVGAGYWVEQLLIVGTGGLAILMIGAIISHINVKDELNKSIPATIMLGLCVFVLSITLS